MRSPSTNPNTMPTLDACHTLAPSRATRACSRLADALRRGKQAVGVGSSGSSTNLLAGLLRASRSRPVGSVVAHPDDADDAADELNDLFPLEGAARAVRFPALELAPGDSHVSVELFAERLSVVRLVSEGRLRPGQTLVAPIAALMQAVPTPARLPRLSLSLRRGDQTSLAQVLHWLDQAGYERTDAIEEPGQFSIRGGILDVFPPASTVLAGGVEEPGATPVRLDFFGDEIDTIHEVALETLAADRRLDRVDLVGASLRADHVRRGHGQPARLAARGMRIDPARDDGDRRAGPRLLRTHRRRPRRVRPARGPETAQGKDERSRRDQPVLRRLERGGGEDRTARPDPADVRARRGRAVRRTGRDVARRRARAAPEDAEDPMRLRAVRASDSGSTNARASCTAASCGRTDGRALRVRHAGSSTASTRRRVRRVAGGARASGRQGFRAPGLPGAGARVDAFIDLRPQHSSSTDHGIAKFLGLNRSSPRRPRRQKADQPAPEVPHPPVLRRRQDPRPGRQIELVEASAATAAPLSVIGGTRKQPESKAGGRSATSPPRCCASGGPRHAGVRYPGDTAWQVEFEAEFPTTDRRPVDRPHAIKKDMTAERPMDRLLCGDVGYGKTELAIRAAFKAAEYGKQVAILVPTTVLAEQHGKTFSERFAEYPFRIEVLSRLRSTKEQNAALAALRKGEVDIIIGTHRLLSKDVRFADLGLVIIDEEQRFGVEHKQRLLSLRMTVDVLTLSATPIPRTLHMALLGIRDISSLTTPPVDRRAVVTEVAPYNEKRIRQAISRELNRDGQVFFVHNRVHNIQPVADDIQKLAPGREDRRRPRAVWHELEEVMLAFTTRKADILVSTTIIESGIDIPTANTMIINDADRFGLAELHQLRPRRAIKHRGYCYLLLPAERPVTDKSAKPPRHRGVLDARRRSSRSPCDLRDPPAPGTSSGAEQSGHIAAVGTTCTAACSNRRSRNSAASPRATPAK